MIDRSESKLIAQERVNRARGAGMCPARPVTSKNSPGSVESGSSAAPVAKVADVARRRS